MSSTSSPNITQVSFRSPGAEPSTTAETPDIAGDDRMSILRAEIDSLSQTVADLAARGTAAVESAASDGVGSLRETIEHRPWMAVGVAVVFGAVIAVAVAPRSRSGVRFGDRTTYNVDDLSSTMRRAVDRRIDTQPLMSRFERMMDSISTIDPATLTASPAYETAKSWVQTLLTSVRKA